MSADLPAIGIAARLKAGTTGITGATKIRAISRSARLQAGRSMVWLLVSMCLLGTAAAAAQSGLAATPEVDAALAQARAQIDAGQAGAAVEQLTALHSTDPRVLRMLGVAYYHHDDYPKAIELLAPLTERFPRDSFEGRETVQVLGLAYYLAGHLAEAIPLLEATRAWATTNIELAQVLGAAYIQTRQPDKAVAPLAQSFGIEPGTAGAYLLAAQTMVRLEFNDMADELLRKALTLDPRLPHANLLLGQNAVFRNRLDEGVAYFRKELAVNPANAMALYRLGEAYSRQQDWDKAIPALQQSLWINPFFSGPYIVLGRAYLAKGQAATAEGMLRRAVDYDPNNKAARYLYGQVLQRLGRADDAKAQFDAASKLQDGR